ncbi:uncharacterized protein [Triticum aestivum]|uniref:uncharacterized protein n=1 Tax=Triticum aestivum TaxID=4565 RepID=UPI001D03005F|nr:uncharacterized protein LOC123167738 [Triticum aestivum]
MKGLLLCALALAFAAVTTHAQLQSCPTRCGKQADGMECPNNLCCSKDGYCGLGVDYCSTGAGCQSGACYDNKICGAQANGTLCPNNHCCGSGGRCDHGSEYCSNGCQNGPCWANLKCGHLDNASMVTVAWDRSSVVLAAKTALAARTSRVATRLMVQHAPTTIVAACMGLVGLARITVVRAARAAHATSVTVVELDEPTEYDILWKCTANGQYSTASAYKAQFLRMVLSPIHRMVWKAWAPPKVKFFAWLALQDRIWTADRLVKRG